MLQVLNNDQIDKRETEKLEGKDLEERQAEPIIQGLAAYVKLCWEPAKDARQVITTRMNVALRQRNNTYDSDKLTEIQKFGGSDIFIGITEVKARAAESWLRDILLETGTPLWDMKATPIPELSTEQMEKVKVEVAQEMHRLTVEGTEVSDADKRKIEEIVQQKMQAFLLEEASEAAEQMKIKIEDQFAEGGWSEAFNTFITDLVTYPCAFIKGPIIRRQRKLAYVPNDEGKIVVEPEEILAPGYERVDPFNIYPEPGVTNINDGYIFQHHSLTRMELSDLIGVPNYDEEAIRKILEVGNSQSWVNRSETHEKEQEESKFQVDLRPTGIYDTLEFWGRVSGKMLIEWGMSEEEVTDTALEYDVNIWLVGNYVIKAVLNYDPLGDKPYAKTSFIKTPGAFWGKGIPEIIAGLQSICNATVRAMVNNLGIASGFQAVVNTSRMAAGEDITEMYPHKIWQTISDPSGSSEPAIRFTQPADNSNSLTSVYDKFSSIADDHSGIPAYVYGNLDVQGAGRTASGLSMLMGSAGKSIRQVVMHIDNDIVKEVVRKQFIYNMRYDKDQNIKGDVTIVPKGTVSLAVKETVNMRRIEFLNATNNETDIRIMGLKGRAAVLAEVVKGLQLPVDAVIPSSESRYFEDKEEAEAQSQAQAPMANSNNTPKAASLEVGGSPKGGREANTVSPKGTNQ